MELLLPLVVLALAPLLVDAWVYVNPARLVHEEHLPTIGSEPVFTLGRFVDELLKMRGDKIYSNAIPGIRPHKRPLFGVRPSSFKPINIQQNKRKPPYPYRNVRINNMFRPYYPKNWNAYTQVIFHPVRSEVIDITLAPSTWHFAESNTVEKIAITSTSAPLLASAAPLVTQAETYPSPRQDEFEAVTAPTVINENLMERSIKVEPNADLQTSSTTSSVSTVPSFQMISASKAFLNYPTKTDLVDALRRDLKARKSSASPFVATGKIFKKRNNQWTPDESSGAVKAAPTSLKLTP